MAADQPTDDQLTPEELLGWAEFCCWTALVLAPLIYWLQGPSVSTDQFVVRTGLVVLAAVGAIVLRTLALVRKFRDARRKVSPPPGTPPTSSASGPDGAGSAEPH